jgi:integrase
MRITDRTLKALKPAAAGSRYELIDTDAPGLRVRVTDNGVRSFVLSGRFPGARWSTRRALGVYDEMSLEEAREKAREWRRAIRKGENPAEAERAARRAAEAKAACTFATVATAFIEHCRRQGHRRVHDADKDLEREFTARWRNRPVTSITSADVRNVIEDKVDAGYQAQATNLFGLIRRLFNWAIGTDRYGIDVSPCARLRPAALVGERRSRDRVLDDTEILAFWRATGRMGQPFGPLYRLLLLTALRKSEVAEAVRSELDLVSRRGPDGKEHGLVWIISADRMKSGRPHAVPLAPQVVEEFRSLPHYEKGECLFTTTFGAKPVGGFSKAKARLDAFMLSELRKIAEERGTDPAQVELVPFVTHDLRRSGRTRMAKLRVPTNIAEAVIAHARPGLEATYNLYEYLDEKRDALERLANHVRDIVEPAPANVAGFPRRAR